MPANEDRTSPFTLPSGSGLSRRALLKGGVLSTAAAALAQGTEATAQAARVQPPAALERVPIAVTINGASIGADVDPALDLLTFLRDERGLTGTKIGCAHGQCGACTVHVDGERVLSCLTLAAKTDGRSVTTIEGLAGAATEAGIATQDELHPAQAAFLDHDGFQCGYCTPGQVMSAAALMANGGLPAGDAALRDAMSGNLCRCGAYAGIEAVLRQLREGAA